MPVVFLDSDRIQAALDARDAAEGKWRQAYLAYMEAPSSEANAAMHDAAYDYYAKKRNVSEVSPIADIVNNPLPSR